MDVKSKAKMTVSAAAVIAVLAGFTCAQTRPAKSEPNPDEPIIRNYILTMDNVRKYADVAKMGEAAAKKDPALAAEMKKVGDMNGYNVQKAEMMDKSPRIAAFLKSNGMTARDFVFIPMTAFTAALGMAAEDSKKPPPAFINPVNIKFVRDHKQELDKLNLFASDEN